MTFKRLTAIYQRLLLLLITFAVGTNLGLGVPIESPSGQEAPQNRLEELEDLSESLANDLLDLSHFTRSRDLSETAAFFPAQLTARPFPDQPTSVKWQIKWIGTHGWTSTTAGQPETVSRSRFLKGWSELLAHLCEIEDARFKVNEASFSTVADSNDFQGQAKIDFYLIGRNCKGQREWIRGKSQTRVRKGQTSKRWQFDSFLFSSLESMVSRVDLFSEVSTPAGVAVDLPSYGSPGNDGFIWRGSAASDFNMDGWMDLFVTSGTRNYLYLNDHGKQFREISEEVGVRDLASGVAPVVFDADNDGDKDVFISAVGRQILLENRLIPEGKMFFHDVSVEANVDVAAVGFSATAGDVNGDSWPDIYVTSYNDYGRVTPDSWFRATNGTPNLLFVNKGNGRFREEAVRWGVQDRRWSYAASFVDINQDGRLDLYVVNDFGENGFFINQGTHFVDQAEQRGVSDPGNGMGVSFGDFDNDGLIDLHVTNMSSIAGNRILSRLFPESTAEENVLIKLASGNTLFENKGQGFYQDVTDEVGGLSAGWAWGGGFIDFDNDGWEDIYTPNGFISGKSMKDT